MQTRTNEEWLAGLRSGGEAHQAALADLREAILAGLPYALSGWLSPDSPQWEALAEEVVRETLAQVLQRLDTFEGHSHFIVWVYKIAAHTALTELRSRGRKNL